MDSVSGGATTATESVWFFFPKHLQPLLSERFNSDANAFTSGPDVGPSYGPTLKDLRHRIGVWVARLEPNHTLCAQTGTSEQVATVGQEQAKLQGGLVHAQLLTTYKLIQWATCRVFLRCILLQLL